MFLNHIIFSLLKSDSGPITIFSRPSSFINAALLFNTLSILKRFAPVHMFSGIVPSFSYDVKVPDPRAPVSAILCGQASIGFYPACRGPISFHRSNPPIGHGSQTKKPQPSASLSYDKPLGFRTRRLMDIFRYPAPSSSSERPSTPVKILANVSLQIIPPLLFDRQLVRRPVFLSALTEKAADPSPLKTSGSSNPMTL